MTSLVAASALYDIPGPKTRGRHRLYSLLALVGIAGLLSWVGYELVATGQFSYTKWNPFQYKGIQRLLWHGLLNTLKAFGLAAAFALAFGVLFAAAGSPSTGRCAGSAPWWWSSSGPCRCW